MRRSSLAGEKIKLIGVKLDGKALEPRTMRSRTAT